jgi:hypothetical protein
MTRFISGVWDFVVGDDPWTALGVVVALGLTGLLAGAGISAFWVMPGAVLLLLVQALARARRR